MITKRELAASMARECDICVHLFGKLTPAAYEYRPGDGQRTTTELLRYLSMVGIGGTRALVEGGWAGWGELQARAEQLSPERFPEAMMKQKADITAYLEALDDQTVATKEATMPGGQKLPLDVALMNGPVKWLAAYKMQLFLYAKANGATSIGTTNAWAGVDAPAK